MMVGGASPPPAVQCTMDQIDTPLFRVTCPVRLRPLTPLPLPTRDPSTTPPGPNQPQPPLPGHPPVLAVCTTRRVGPAPGLEEDRPAVWGLRWCPTHA